MHCNFRCLETTQAVDIESCLVSYVQEELKCKIPKKGTAMKQKEGVCNTVQQFKDYERIHQKIQVGFTT